MKLQNIIKECIDNVILKYSLTESETANNKQMVIMRGLPGAGKSTRIKSKYPNATICSADHYFIDNTGTYNFNPTKLKSAHDACYAKAEKAVWESAPLIVIDNTNTQKWEFQKYVDLARQGGYELVTDDIFDGGASDEELFGRNSHGVPLQNIKQMRQRWEK